MLSIGDRVRELIGVTAWESAKAFLGSTIAGGSYYLYSSHNEFYEKYRFWIGLILGGTLIFLCMALYRRFRVRPSFPRLEFDFTLKKKEIIFQYYDRISAVYTKRIRVKGMRSALTSYPDRYKWTGKNVVPRSGIEGQTLRLTSKKNVWQCYEIEFEKTLMKDEETDTEMICELTDPERAAVPFISATIDEPTEFLRMVLIAPVTLGIHQCVCEVSTTISSKAPLSSEIIQEQNGQIAWLITKPKLLHHYEMKWAFREEQNNEHQVHRAAGTS